jgi:NTE family protein
MRLPDEQPDLCGSLCYGGEANQRRIEMTKNALVLGGGGALGVAWETGMLVGLREAGVDPAAAGLVVGTSAGSIVGTYVASGRLDEGLEQQSQGEDAQISAMIAEADVQKLLQVFARWGGLAELTQDSMKEIGEMALAAKTAPEERWTGYFRELVPADWPATPLKLTAVEAATGAFQAWDRDSGVPLYLAAASSCSVPGLFPPVTINGKRYTDGGVRSGTSADLASGYESVLIIAPIGGGTTGIDPLLGRQARAEAEALRAGGSRVELVFPDEGSMETIGINRMDSSRRPQVIEAGKAQGKALAAAVAEMWLRVAA